MVLISDSEREQRIREFMDKWGMTRQEAEFAVAVDLGEIQGDAIEVKDAAHAEPGTRD